MIVLYMLLKPPTSRPPIDYIRLPLDLQGRSIIIHRRIAGPSSRVSLISVHGYMLCLSYVEISLYWVIIVIQVCKLLFNTCHTLMDAGA